MATLVDVVRDGLKEVIDWIAGAFGDGLRSGYETLTEELFGTPTPTTDGAFVFGMPTNAPWVTIREALIGGEIMMISLLLLVACVQGRHTARIFSLGSAYEARKTKKAAWTGAVLIVAWYWISVLSLYLIDGFTVALMPGLNSLGKTMLGFLQVSLMNPMLALTFAFLGGLSMWTLEAMYYLREIPLYVYVYGMPIAIALTYGNLPIVSDIAVRFARRFVPLAVLPIPAAIVFKGYDLIYGSEALVPQSPFLQYLVASSLPLVALFVTWKTFTYATPLTARALGTATKGAVTISAVATGAYVAGPGVASTVARRGPRVATKQAVAEHVSTRMNRTPESNSESSYRRTENDP